MVREVSARKKAYRERLISYVQDYKSIIVVTANHVGSHQIQRIRQELRGRAAILFGKNTLMRMVLRDIIETNPDIEKFVPCVKGNCGLIFTNEDIKEIRDVVVNNKVKAAAKSGVIAPNDVTVPPGPTGLDPGQTSFFQALNIGTKIFKGQIEITSKVYLIKKGDKVGNSEAAFLDKLNITPFEYGLVVDTIYSEGAVFEPEVLDLTESDLASKFFSAVRVVASLGLRLGLPNIASLPHSFANAFKKLLALSVQSDYSFEASVKYKEYLADPTAYMAAHGMSAAPAAAAGGEDKSEEAAEPEPEEDEESSDDAGLGMFGDDSDSD